jgi:hypothetical protein
MHIFKYNIDNKGKIHETIISFNSIKHSRGSEKEDSGGREAGEGVMKGLRLWLDLDGWKTNHLVEGTG